jgi:hypothetical protein
VGIHAPLTFLKNHPGETKKYSYCLRVSSLRVRFTFWDCLHFPYAYIGGAWEPIRNHFTRRKRDLKLHNFFIQQEKPHKCSLCAKSFPTPGDLRSHMYVHSGSWPFKCQICSRGFSKQTNLKNHLFLHTGESRKSGFLIGLGTGGSCKISIIDCLANIKIL